MPEKFTNFTGKPLMRLLLLSTLCLICFDPYLYAQEREYLNIVTLDEPEWVYRSRGDRLFNEGKYGDALAQYKKALIKRNQGIHLQSIEGVDTEKGILRQNNDLSAYVHKLQLFFDTHEESSMHIRKAIAEKRYAEARSVLQSLQHDAFEIGAEGLSHDAETLNRSIYLRKETEWDYLEKRLFGSYTGNNEGSLTAVVQALSELVYDAGDGDIKLRLETQENIPYPEVHLKIAQIYIREGLFDLALQELDMAEKGSGYFQIQDLIYTVMYTRADIFRILNNMSEYQRSLQRIIVPEAWDKWEGDDNFRIYGNMSLHKVSVAAVKVLIQDAEKRKKYGKAYFEYGRLSYQNGRYVSAEPYLKMALLYGFGYGKEKEFLIAKEMLREYYISSERRTDATQIDHIDDMIMETLKKSDETRCISF
jgi:tetratricopeptide (TPR) repeat protein